jgi:multidrug efflux pump
VVKTLLEAIVLVFLVMYLFLQNFRATLIPTIAVPVVLLGTFGVLAAFGFSINTLTMFGMVLAIGLLVDDAIVVVENVERVMSEEGLSPREAPASRWTRSPARWSASAWCCRRCSCRWPSSAARPASSTASSRSPSSPRWPVGAGRPRVHAGAVRHHAETGAKGHGHGEGGWFGGFFGWFNRMFERNTAAYERGGRRMLLRSGRYLVIYALIVVVLGFLFVRMPTSFLPEEDQGVMFTQVQLPAGATQERTIEVLKKVERHFLDDEKDGRSSIFTVAGFSFGGRGQNMGIGFVKLSATGSERQGPGMSVKAIAGRAMAAFSPDPRSDGLCVRPAGGDRTGHLQRLQRPAAGPQRPRPRCAGGARNQFLGMARRTSGWSACARMARKTCPSTSSTSTMPRPAPSG